MTLDRLHQGTVDVIHSIFRDQDSTWPRDDSLQPDVFLDEIDAQGMAPVLWYRVAGGQCCDDWPEVARHGLRNLAMQEAASDLLARDETISVLNKLAGIGVVPVLLKGTPLSYTLYPAPGMRPRCDTDLLIPESAREQVFALMRRLGYKGLYEVEIDFISSQMSFSRQGKVNVWHSYDIHWRASNNSREFSRRFNYDRLLADSIGVSSLGEHARALNDVDALILACVHRAGHFSHSGDRLIWLYDIHLLCEHFSDSDASAFYRRAGELEIVNLCVDAILMAQSWFDTRLPPLLVSLQQEEGITGAPAAHLPVGREQGIRSNTLRELKSLSGWRERVSFLAQNAFPPADYMRWRYDEQRKSRLPWLYIKRFAEAVSIFLRR